MHPAFNALPFVVKYRFKYHFIKGVITTSCCYLAAGDGVSRVAAHVIEKKPHPQKCREKQDSLWKRTKPTKQNLPPLKTNKVNGRILKDNLN